jgi:hypothetical protein
MAAIFTAAAIAIEAMAARLSHLSCRLRFREFTFSRSAFAGWLASFRHYGFLRLRGYGHYAGFRRCHFQIRYAIIFIIDTALYALPPIRWPLIIFSSIFAFFFHFRHFHYAIIIS